MSKTRLRSRVGCQATVAVAMVLTLGCGRLGYETSALDAMVSTDTSTPDTRPQDSGDLDSGDLDSGVDGSPPPDPWVRATSGGGRNEVQGLAVDSASNVYAVGFFEGTTDFGSGAVTSAGGRDGFVMSYASDGRLRWLQIWASVGMDEPEAVRVAADGTVWVIGYFERTIDFGGGPLSSAGDRDIVVLHVESDGTHIASRRFGDAGDDRAVGLAIDRAGGTLVTGSFRGTLDLGGPVPLATPAPQSIFAARFDRSIGHVWSRAWGDTRLNVGLAVTVDLDDNSYVAGFYEGNLDFGGGPSAYRGIQDAFVLALDPAGAYRWDVTFGSGGFDYAHSVAVDEARNVYLSGFVEGPSDPGGGPIGGAGGRDGYVVSYDRAGVHRWSVVLETPGCDNLRAVVVGADGHLYVAGYFERTADLGGGPVTSAGSRDVVVTSLTTQGVHRWTRRFGNSRVDLARALAVDATGAVYVAGLQDGVDEACGRRDAAGDAYVRRFEP